ncbi:hypothetical protein KAW08_05515 [bacterium]|nr:hypothetical protein [bacterium]
MNVRKIREPEFMRELHRIREEMYHETKRLTPRQRVNKTHRETEDFLQSQGYRLVSGNQGYRMVHLKK